MTRRISYVCPICAASMIESDEALLRQALEQWRQAVRAMEASIDAVQPEASTTLEQAESHAHICAKLAEEHKDDVLVCVALTDAAAIIRDLLRELRLRPVFPAATGFGVP